MTYWVKLIRPKHWIKNFLVFAPIFFAGRIFEFFFLKKVSWAFLVFCLSASSCYIFNDLLDRKYDINHPIKKERPIASGEVSFYFAFLLTIIFSFSSLILAYCLNTHFFYTILIYLLINILYSLGLKNIIPLDVFCISLGYLLRIIGGGKAANIKISPWLFMTAFLLALFIAFGKRLGELESYQKTKDFRPVLSHYNQNYIYLCLGISGSSALVTYALYTVEKGGYLVYSMIPAAYGIMRYLKQSLAGKGEDPIDTFFKDVHLWISTVIFIVGIGFSIYDPRLIP